ncbi:MAG TPA: gamma-glutamyl-gamma-aminobutyrate hydrolase family protein [Bryobacteraceae bacterium]|nr:gamma-glutamyl-gamma-aminobutyrate hydrolase family protein [Bryobacteraceae bacterium]
MVPIDCGQSRRATRLDPHSTRVLLIYREADRLPPYETAARAADLIPVSILPEESFAMDEFDGVILTGGTDIDPALYGETRQRETDVPDPDRDAAEVSLVRQALERDMPILAICRGHQLLNVALGGTLVQHMEGHQQRTEDRSLPAHNIAIKSGTLLNEIADAEIWPVNSRHHQAIKSLAPDLRVAAVDERDNTIEAIYHPKRRFVLGVQWHPEDQIFRYPEQLDLFRALATAKRRIESS